MSLQEKTIDDRYVAELAASVQHWRISYEKAAADRNEAMALCYEYKAKLDAIKRFIDWHGDVEDITDAMDREKVWTRG